MKREKTFLLAVLIPLIILLAMTVKPQATVLFGQEIVLETKAFDPTDLFRGLCFRKLRDFGYTQV